MTVWAWTFHFFLLRARGIQFTCLGLSQSTYIYLRFIILLSLLLHLVLPWGYFPSPHRDKFCKHVWFLPSLPHSPPIFLIKAFRQEVNTISCSSSALISVGYPSLVLAFLLCNTQNQNSPSGVSSQLFCHIRNTFGLSVSLCHCCVEDIKRYTSERTVLTFTCKCIKCSVVNVKDKVV